jgi:hypothetical protein
MLCFQHGGHLAWDFWTGYGKGSYGKNKANFEVLQEM